MRRSRTTRTTTSRRLLRGVAITVCMVLASLPVPAQESWLEAAGDTARCGAQGAQETEKEAKQAERHVTRATMLAVGGTNLLETYLSPEKYTGTEWRLMQHVTRDYPTRPRWAHQLLHEAHLSATRNRADNASYLTAFYHFEYDWHRRLATLPLAGGTISLKAGPGVDALAGMVYSTRNGNNPAQAHLALAGLPPSWPTTPCHGWREDGSGSCPPQSATSCRCP